MICKFKNFVTYILILKKSYFNMNYWWTVIQAGT